MDIKDWLGENNTLGIDIWEKKYRYKNETFDDWIDRVSAGNSYLKKLILEKKFLFGGRILANRGLQKMGKKITYSNCYVIAPPEDNIESIYDTASKLARTYSYGGGCGIDISKLAPRGAKVNNAALETSGAVSFMDTYSQVTAQIGQAGRRGALMISIDCHHPDLEEFLDVKTDLNKVTKANISVRITDDFMQAVKKNEEFELSFTRKETEEVIAKKVNARDMFMKLAKNNWDFAEPGCLFWDRISNYNLLSNTKDFSYAGTNPCAEEPLPAGGSCLLGSINLAEFVKNNKFDYDDFRNTVHTSVIALNEVLDEGLELHPLSEQRNSVRDWRQIGLGIMGLADMLIKLQIKYGSRDSLKLCDQIGQIMTEEAILTSAKLAFEHGMFNKCNSHEICSTEFFKNNVYNSDVWYDVENYGLRNSQLLTIAPTGTLSTMLGISGGIEPIFANYYTRKTESLHGHDEYYKVYTPIVDNYMKEHGLTDDSQLPDFFVTAQNLNYKNRIEMQSIWQSHIDASISSTVNVPNDFTVEDTFNLYTYAWEMGLKGVTIFRDGCKRTGILTTAEPKLEEKKEESNVLKRGDWKPKASDTVYYQRKLKIGCGKLNLFVGWSDNEQMIQDLYIKKSGSGGCERLEEAIAITMSAIFRLGGTMNNIEKAFTGIGACNSFTSARAKGSKLSAGSSCATAVLNELKKFISEKTGEASKIVSTIKLEKPSVTKVQVSEVKSKAKCPDCGEPLVFEGGCNVCKSCGWSKCS